jgi:hypothetical protein
MTTYDIIVVHELKAELRTSSTVIEDLEKRRNEKRLAYWYFQFSDEATQVTCNMVRSFIRQLSISPLLEAINPLWEKHKRRSSDPDIAELIGILDNLIDNFGEVFIVIDALDECPQMVDQREREKLLNLIRNLLSKHSKNLHILATSRPEPDIHSELKSYLNVNIGGVIDGDVKLFVKNAIYLGGLKVWDDNIKKYIEKKLLEVEERCATMELTN